MKWMTSVGHIDKGNIVQSSLFFRKYFENVFGAVISLERHSKGYCKSFCCSEKGRTLKLFLPKCKASNAWRWLVYYGNKEYNYCLRWTLPSFKRWMVKVRYRIKRYKTRNVPRSSGEQGCTTSGIL